MELSNVVFDAPLHVPAMHQVVVAHLANCRQGTHSTKTRGEVSGGGRKPWKQKHTGRARQGSTRSPIWVHGGVAHGPKPRDYHQKVNKKVRRLAMLSALSVKVRDSLMTVVRGMEMDKPSTKAALASLRAIVDDRQALVVLERGDQLTALSLRNVPEVHVLWVDQLNTYDVLDADDIVFTQAALESFLGTKEETK